MESNDKNQAAIGGPVVFALVLLAIVVVSVYFMI